MWKLYTNIYIDLGVRKNNVFKERLKTQLCYYSVSHSFLSRQRSFYARNVLGPCYKILMLPKFTANKFQI